jgi:pimeloyl-ACP methyl ester carboxylesterase
MAAGSPSREHAIHQCVRLRCGHDDIVHDSVDPQQLRFGGARPRAHTRGSATTTLGNTPPLSGAGPRSPPLIDRTAPSLRHLMPKVRVGDIDMHYVEVGAGEPLLLIMGLSGDHLAWGFQIPAFAEKYHVISFDNRGAGQTDQPDHRYTTRMMADDTAGLMDALDVESADVLGVSMGGMIAQELAINHPRRVRSLQLHCTSARPDRYLRELVGAWRAIRSTLPFDAALRTVFLGLFAPATYNERPEFVQAVLDNALANPFPQSLVGLIRQSQAVESHDALDRLSAIRCPTLVTVADEDILVPPRFSRMLADHIAGAEFRTIAGAGHVYFWERPDEFNKLCLSFLETRR